MFQPKVNSTQGGSFGIARVSRLTGLLGCLALSSWGAWTDGGSHLHTAGERIIVGSTSVPGYVAEFRVVTTGLTWQALRLVPAGTNSNVTLSGAPNGTGFFVVNSQSGSGIILSTGSPSTGSGRGDERMRITSDGKVLIGTSTGSATLTVNGSVAAPSACIGSGGCGNQFGYPLAVNGSIRAKEVVVETEWPDFVFHKDYPLMPLEKVEKFIAKNGHLPEIPAEKVVKEKGVNLGDMNAKLLQKVEELTLYIIEQEKRIKMLEVAAGKK